MSWMITDQSADYLKVANPLHPAVQFFSSNGAILRTENDNVIVCAIGRVRSYNNDYLVVDDYSWLAALFDNEPLQVMHQLAGFFLIVIFNKRDNSVTVINDHVGSIPCYVDQRDATVLNISDSIPALLAQNPATELNAQALFNYVFYHCIPSPISVYQGISKLEPGVIAKLTPNNIEQISYYQPDFSPSTDSTDVLMRRCAELISEAVRRNITDDCAAFLSGGLDSSTVAGMLAKHSKPLGKSAKTYSIGFEAKGYDETEYALLTANHFATNHKVHYLQPDEIAEHFTQVAGYFDEPFGNSSAMAA
ncbi:MAG TPA: asparagine synthase-related protein, partial [Rheinheimera sp.]|nr:asparagine synthase-related protein [Rheinheimera sp.]